MSNNIDENLYSRQLYAIGFDAMKKMICSNVLISGMTGLGIEIAKNVILQGCKKVTLHDTRFVTNDDLSTNYYISGHRLHRVPGVQAGVLHLGPLHLVPQVPDGQVLGGGAVQERVLLGHVERGDRLVVRPRQTA